MYPSSPPRGVQSRATIRCFNSATNSRIPGSKGFGLLIADKLQQPLEFGQQVLPFSLTACDKFSGTRCAEFRPGRDRGHTLAVASIPNT